MVKIILIQHCQSEHHINNMSGGWTDTSLTELGRSQANLIGLKLKEELNPMDYIIYSSDLKRAWQTAEIVGNHLNLNILKKKALREINTGIAAGKTKDWAKTHRNPHKGHFFELNYQEFQEGETRREFYVRVYSCMEEIITNSKEKDLMIITHGGTLGYIIAWWLKFEEKMLINTYFSASPASISILHNENYYRQQTLSVFNDKSHLYKLNKTHHLF